jgi:oxygen-independent coproporphyrinogen-3 oxidase
MWKGTPYAHIDCDICIELHPASMDDDCPAALREAGVTMLSIGVESTSDRILERIGRSHDGRMAVDAVERTVRAGFSSVNADLMFALPGQTFEDWQNDVAAVICAGVDQLSTYPLFSFPYSDLGQQKGIQKVIRPEHAVVREMLAFTHEYCENEGLKRCAVWSWLRPSRSKFSSITRHHYVGFGPSAASMTGREFYVNTFDVRAYAESLPNRRPVAVSMPMSRRLERAYWLYWRVYELKFSQADFEGVFGGGKDLHGEFGGLFAPVRAIGMLKRRGHSYEITPSGAYWIHRLQNEYSLNYINRLWGTCRQTPWPQEVRL